MVDFRGIYGGTHAHQAHGMPLPFKFPRPLQRGIRRTVALIADRIHHHGDGERSFAQVFTPPVGFHCRTSIHDGTPSSASHIILVSIIRTAAIRSWPPAGAHRLMPGQLYAQATRIQATRTTSTRNRQSEGQLRLPHCLPPTPGRPSAPHGPFPCSRSQSRWCFIATSMMCASSSPR